MREAIIPNATELPRIQPKSGAVGWRGIQRPGELMILPASNQPHAVVNLAQSLSWSMNFVHQPNLLDHLQELVMENRWRVVETMTHPQFAFGASSSKQDTPFGEFKSKNHWKKEMFDIIEL